MNTAVAVILCVLGSTQAMMIPNLKPAKQLSMDPEPCCGPPQWEAVIGGVIGIVQAGAGKVMQFGGHMSVDANLQRTAISETVNVAGQAIQVQILQDFNMSMQYTVTGGKCVTSKIPDSNMKPNCVPSDATFGGRYYFGAGEDMLMANSWSFTHQDNQYIMSVTEKGCFPIIFNQAGTIGGNPGMLTFGYANITSGVKDPSVFNIPPSCKSDHDPKILEHSTLHRKVLDMHLHGHTKL